MTAAGAAAWQDALIAAKLLASARETLGGIRVRAHAGPVRNAWLAALRDGLGEGCRVRTLPHAISPDRLLGGIDLAATLAGGRPHMLPGLLAEADGGVLIVPMAERMAAHVSAALIEALDRHAVRIERDGFSLAAAARLTLVLLDESDPGEDPPPRALLDRIGLDVSLDHIAPRETGAALARPESGAPVADPLATICAIAAALGIEGHRPALFALAAARALSGGAIGEGDIALATRLCLLPRARRIPQAADDPADQPAEPPPPGAEPETGTDGEAAGRLADRIVEAAAATLPPGLLAGLAEAAATRASSGGAGSAGLRASKLRGRPVGAQTGMPGGGARLHLSETLRAAAPWQRLRRREAGRIAVRKADFRIHRFAERAESLLIFLVDASGSAAAERLAEAKGAVELLLAQAYAKRTFVALIAFRETAADLIVAPTRSLTRAKRCLADGARGRGRTPFLILLTDGRANMTLAGEPDRARAESEARLAARRLRAMGVKGVVIDISARPRDAARSMAEELGADHVALPRAAPAGLARAVGALVA